MNRWIASLLLFVLVLTHGPAALAQSAPVPVEGMLGNRGLYFQMTVAKPLGQKPTWSSFNVTTLFGDYENKKNDFFSQSLLLYNINHHVALHSGLTMNIATGFHTIVGAQFKSVNKNHLWVALPNMELSKKKDLGLFSVYEQRFKASEQLTLYTRLQGVYAYNLTEEHHSRSYIYLRMGWTGIKGGSQGIAYNYDRYGPFKASYSNLGVFITKPLF